MFGRKPDRIDFGGKKIEIPKLTVAKWRLLFDRIEILPSVLLNIFSARNSSDFTATIVAGTGLIIDEVVELISALTGYDPQWIEENVTHTELIDFITNTVQKNDLVEAGKKFRAAFGKMLPLASNAASPSTNGSSTAPSDLASANDN